MLCVCRLERSRTTRQCICRWLAAFFIFQKKCFVCFTFLTRNLHKSNNILSLVLRVGFGKRITKELQLESALQLWLGPHSSCEEGDVHLTFLRITYCKFCSHMKLHLFHAFKLYHTKAGVQSDSQFCRYGNRLINLSEGQFVHVILWSRDSCVALNLLKVLVLLLRH